MQLDEFYDYKNQFMKDMVTNDEIVKLLTDSDDVESMTEDERMALIYSQIFPYEYVPETVEHGTTYICCDVDIKKSLNKTYLMPILYVWVFSHRSKLRLEEGGVRPDKVCSEIAKALNGSRMYGLGELDLYSVDRFAPMTDYQGKAMTFTMTEWNRPSPNPHPIPANRKLGR